MQRWKKAGPGLEHALACPFNKVRQVLTPKITTMLKKKKKKKRDVKAQHAQPCTQAERSPHT